MRVAQLDAADLLTRVALTSEFDGASARGEGRRFGGTSTGRRIAVDLVDVAGVYYRRPTQFLLIYQAGPAW